MHAVFLPAFFFCMMSYISYYYYYYYTCNRISIVIFVVNEGCYWRSFESFDAFWTTYKLMKFEATGS
jgi:hypothetical protein